MALPLLNETPTYQLVVPSTGKKIKYRPYLVKEEKILLMANETKDETQIINAITDTIVACTDNKIKIEELTTFDLEFLFLKIRSKSVGENVELFLPCSSCKQRNETVVNLDLIECPVVETENLIQVNDSVSVEMKYPSYFDIEQGGDESEVAFNVVSSCIKAVITKEERFDISDEPKETVRAFLESMTSAQFANIAEFVQSLPQIKHTIEFDCDNCGEHNSIEVKGIHNFF